jgi:hypothetical protein
MGAELFKKEVEKTLLKRVNTIPRKQLISSVRKIKFEHVNGDFRYSLDKSVLSSLSPEAIEELEVLWILHQKYV